MGRREQFTVGELTVTNGISMIEGSVIQGINPSGGVDYYVDNNNGSNANDGFSWGTAKKTLAAAMALSHAKIASGAPYWAARNRIFYKADQETADLILFAQKTDVIGVGHDTGFPYAGILGNHIPANTAYGCHFYNVRFIPVAAGPILTLNACAGSAEFHNCLFDANGTLVATKAILATACTYLKVHNCRFQGAFSAQYILFGAGQALGTEICDNIMLDGAAKGVVTDAGTTASYMGLIKGNIIQCAGVTIDTQATSVFVVVGNRLISAGAVGATSHVIDLTYAADNLLTGNDVGIAIPKHIDA
jgi:hypothetical protein